MNMQNVNSIDAFTGRQNTAGKNPRASGTDFMDILSRSIQSQRTQEGAGQKKEAQTALERSGGKRSGKAASRKDQKPGRTDEKDKVSAQKPGGTGQNPDPVQDAQLAGAAGSQQELQREPQDAAEGTAGPGQDSEEVLQSAAEAGAQQMAGQAVDAAEDGAVEAAGNASGLQGGIPALTGAAEGNLRQAFEDMFLQTDGTKVSENSQEQAAADSSQSVQTAAGQIQNGQQAAEGSASQTTVGETTAGQSTDGILEGQAAGRIPGQTEASQAAGVRGTGQEAAGQNGSLASADGQGEESLKEQAEVMKQMAAGNLKAVPEASEKTGKAADTEELQKYVDEQVFANPGELAARRVSGSYEVGETKQPEAPQPVMEQLRTGMEQGVSRNLDSFTIRLKPEGLGEILIHLEHAGGRIAMSIGVTNAETQKMLTSEMMNLKEMLKPLNAEVKEIYQSQTENFDMMTYQQNLFRQNRNLFYAGKGGRIRRFEHTEDGISEIQSQTGLPEMSNTAAYTAGGWNAYV